MIKNTEEISLNSCHGFTCVNKVIMNSSFYECSHGCKLHLKKIVNVFLRYYSSLLLLKSLNHYSIYLKNQQIFTQTVYESKNQNQIITFENFSKIHKTYLIDNVKRFILFRKLKENSNHQSLLTKFMYDDKTTHQEVSKMIFYKLFKNQFHDSKNLLNFFLLFKPEISLNDNLNETHPLFNDSFLKLFSLYAYSNSYKQFFKAFIQNKLKIIEEAKKDILKQKKLSEEIFVVCEEEFGNNQKLLFRFRKNIEILSNEINFGIFLIRNN